MESADQSVKPPGQPSLRIADVVGTAIALLTLIGPVFVIAYYSASSSESLPPPLHSIPKTK